jgi:sulfofructose kinase
LREGRRRSGGKTVACVGVAVLDLIYGVERLPSEDSKIRAHSLVESGGGMAANAASAISRLGGRATWYGRVGEDEMGTHVLAGLAAEGVETAAQRIAGARTSHSVILVDRGGDRAIVLYGSEALDGDPSWLPLDRVVAHDVVLADIRWIPGAINALTAARAAGRPAVLDADTTHDPMAIAAVKAASHVVFSKSGLDSLFGGGTPEEALRRAADHTRFVAVTLGAQGVLWVDASGGVRHIPAVPIEARETLGAGDVFHGAFALALAEGRTEEQAIEFGAAAAAFKCARTGGRASFPYRNEVDEWNRQNG